MDKLQQQLQSGIQGLDMDISAGQQQQLLTYIQLLQKWNRVYNLTSIRELNKMVDLHLLDALVILPFFQGDSEIHRVLDVGTGGGIPGIPLAICLPDTEFVLLDARNKKIRFLQTVIAQLGLNNVTVIHSRVEDYQVHEADKFDRIISRAFASLKDMLILTQHLYAARGKFLAMKGQIPEQEIAQLPEGFRIEQIHPLEIQGLNVQRHLIEIVTESKSK